MLGGIGREGGNMGRASEFWQGPMGEDWRGLGVVVAGAGDLIIVYGSVKGESAAGSGNLND